jgi:hypothetical protein
MFSLHFPGGMQQQLTGADAARVLLDRMARIRTSPTVLFWLRVRGPTLRTLELGGALLRLCEELNVDAWGLGDDFFRAVRDEAAATVTVAPDVFYAATKKTDCILGFQAAVLRARRANGGAERYHLLGAAMPFCYQLMRGYYSAKHDKHLKASLFLMFAAPEDGMSAIADLLRDGNRWREPSGHTSVFTEIIEQRWGARERDPDAVDNRLSYLITDWEAYRLHARGRLSDAQMVERMEAFPLWFYRRLLALGFVAPDAVVTAVFKDKSRPVTAKDGAADFKFSAHTIFSVTGVPAIALAHACAQAFQPYKVRIDTCKDDYSALLDEELEQPWFGADIKALGGNTGFSTFGSRKKADDPMPALKYRFAFCRGEQLSRTAVGLHDPENIVFAGPGAPVMPHEAVVECLRASLCTVPGYDMVPFTPTAEIQAETKHIRNASKRHQAVSGAGPPLGSPAAAALLQHLPGWVSSEIQPGYSVSANAAATYKQHIARIVEGTKDWHAVHVSGASFYCPVALCELRPIKKRHSRNGVIIVYHPDMHDFVYVRCTKCCHRDQVHGEATVVGGYGRCWAQFTEQSFRALLRLSKAG